MDGIYGAEWVCDLPCGCRAVVRRTKDGELDRRCRWKITRLPAELIPGGACKYRHTIGQKLAPVKQSILTLKGR